MFQNWNPGGPLPLRNERAHSVELIEAEKGKVFRFKWDERLADMARVAQFLARMHKRGFESSVDFEGNLVFRRT